MKRRYILLILLLLLVTNGITAVLVILRHPFDDYAEILYKNQSGRLIRNIELRHFNSQINVPELKPNSQQVIHFYVEGPTYDITCHVSAHFTDGKILEYDDAIGNGAKHTIIIQQDVMWTEIRQSTAL